MDDETKGLIEGASKNPHLTDEARTAAAEAAAELIPITRDQATGLVGKTLLGLLEDVIRAHELVLADTAKTGVQKQNAKLVIAAAQAIGRPLFIVVKASERPRILRPDRSLRVVR